MTFTDEEVRDGLVRLGRAKEAVFLRQRLLQVLTRVVSETADAGALMREQGRRLLAQDLINALELAHARPDDAELASRPDRGTRIAATGPARRVPAVSPDDAAAGR